MMEPINLTMHKIVNVFLQTKEKQLDKIGFSYLLSDEFINNLDEKYSQYESLLPPLDELKIPTIKRE